MKAALCQFQIEYEAKERNLHRAEQMIASAAAEHAEIIFFPEMSFTGFSMHVLLTGESGGEAATRELFEEIGLERDLTAKRPSLLRWGCAFSSVGAPWVAQRVCPIPVDPGTPAPSRVFSHKFAIRPVTLLTVIFCPSITAMPAES